MRLRFITILSIPVLFLLLFSCTPSASSPPETIRPHHDLRVRLFPEQNRLTGTDLIRLHPGGNDSLSFYLSENATVNSVQINGKDRDFTFRRSLLRISLKSGEQNEAIEIAVDYEGVFNDPVPVRPVNTDNPGYGVSGTISPGGVLLLGGSGWYPLMPDTHPTYNIEIDAPEGMRAITAGHPLGHETGDGRSLSRWEVRHPVEALALSAGPYQVQEKRVGGVTAATYFFPGSSNLADGYLEAVAGYIALYADLFGPYPFGKFAVVENFFPTGYGFPSYTLLGTQVLRLPFIIQTSLGHEIAHCWWGNGVYVDFSEGNWSEGLTTYVADYLYKEQQSPEAALQYRLELLRSYAALVDPENDFPLSEFTSRTDRVTQAVGYHKSAMVFHMLRRMVGDDAFWSTLQAIYRERLFDAVGWSGFAAAFADRMEQPFDTFFDQWVRRKGAPELALDDVQVAQEGDDWIVRGNIVQEKPFYHLRVPVLLTAGEDRETTVVEMTEGAAPFTFTADTPPESLIVDPEADLFRHLYPSEVPPTINSVKGAESVLMVLSERGGDELRDAAKLLVMSLGLDNADIISENDLSPGDIKTSSIIFAGLPQRRTLLPELPDSVSLSDTAFTLNGRAFSFPSDAFFGVFPHPASEERVMALFLADDTQAETLARKVTHYGKYSYLAFHNGDNQDRGTWPVTDSPLILRFAER